MAKESEDVEENEMEEEGEVEEEKKMEEEEEGKEGNWANYEDEDEEKGEDDRIGSVVYLLTRYEREDVFDPRFCSHTVTHVHLLTPSHLQSEPHHTHSIM